MKNKIINKSKIILEYQAIRKQTELLCAPLCQEDYVIQGMDDVSPPKWHLAHTTWFFETFILNAHKKNYALFNSTFPQLFNSYYQSLGEPFPRPKRGLLARPTVNAVYDYRHYVDEQFLFFIEHTTESLLASISDVILLGFNHEQQHQELLMMDIKHNLSLDPSFPVYQKNNKPLSKPKKLTNQFINLPAQIIGIGHNGNDFCFDNELPRHKKIINHFSVQNRLITNAEYLEFMKDGGYQNPLWWLSDGWDTVQKNHWQAPLYWHLFDNTWYIFSLNGLHPVNPHEPIVHVSFYEADAYARWRNCRLPTEEEWEYFAANYANSSGNFLENGHYHPDTFLPQNSQLLGDVWEWTGSAYLAYPGFKPLTGNLSEYNGKFMSNQMVLRGGSCVTPKKHLRISYRNFFQQDKRWQFSGIRLAKDE